MFKVSLVALTVAIITSFASNYFVRIEVGENLSSLERRTVTRIRTLSEDLTTSNESMENLIRGSNNLVNSYSKRLNEVKETLDSTNTHTNNELTHIRSQQNNFLEGIHTVESQAKTFESRLISLENNLSEISIPLEALRTDLYEIQTKVNSSNQMELALNTINSTEQETHQLPIYSNSCPSTVLNRSERLPRLKQQLEESAPTGIYDVRAIFDINKGGGLVLNRLESQTAPNRVLGAVRHYVDGLVFDSHGIEFADCEALFKLKVS